MDSYFDDFSRLVLVVEALKESKKTLVKECGVGEDLTFTLFGWAGDRMVIAGQLMQNFELTKEDRIRRVLAAAIIFRTGFGCDSLTFGAEGFCVMQGSEVDSSIPLSDQFATNPDVLECITVLQIGKINDMAAVPYKYGIGREVIFNPVARNPKPKSMGIIYSGLVDALSFPVESKYVGDRVFVNRLVKGLQKDGFEVTRVEK